MKINPIYVKEMKLRVRSAKFAVTVFFFNLILVVIAIIGFEVVFNVRLNAFVNYGGASKVYFILICLEMLMVIAILPSLTAGAIAGEREKQTLEILLTIPLTPRQIILGKLLSSVSMVLLLSISSMPVLSIVFTIGGIDMTDIVQFIFAIFTISFYIGSMGMLSSAILRKTVPATVFSFAEVLLVCGGTIVIVIAAYVMSNLYYYNVSGGNGITPDISSSAYILLLNPAFTILEMVTRQYGRTSVLSTVMEMLGGTLPKTVTQNWYMLSILSQSICTFIFIELAAFFLNPMTNIKLIKRKIVGDL